MSHKPKYDNNYLTAQNGCTIIEQSSQRQRGPASSILSSDPKSVWVTGEKLPQQCVISLKRIIKKPAFYNMVGIYCWHQYDSNPALIEILGKSVPQLDKWHLITKIRLNLIDSWQYFKIEDLNADKIKQIKIRILENFGDTKTYINKVSLHYTNLILSKQNAYASNTNISSNMKVNYSQHEQQMPERPPTLNSNSSPNANANTNTNTNTNTNKSPFSKDQRREKVHSQYYKPDVQNYNSNYTSINSNISTQMQNQLKKANQNIHRLNIQQEQMKKIIQKQQKVIIQMQEAMKIVILSMQKLQKMQQIQNKTQNSYKSSQNFKKIRNQYQFQNNNPYSHIPKHPPKQKVLQKYKISREVPLSSDQQQQNIGKQEIKQKDRIIRSKQKQKFVKKNHQTNKYNEQIQQLSNMLNQYQTKSHVIVNSKEKYQASSSKQRDMQRQRERQRLRIRQKQKQKQKQKKLLKIAELQRKKQSQFRQNSQSYKHQTDIIRTNSQDDLSQYDEYHYKTSQATQNQDLLHPGTKSQKTKQKGQKAKMLQRLVKLIQLKKKKLQLKRSGAKSRQRQSVYQYQQQDDQNQDQNQDEQN